MKVPTLKTGVGAGFVILLLNTGYISAFATASIFYMGNVLLHLVLGLVFAIALAANIASQRHRGCSQNGLPHVKARSSTIRS